MAYCSVRTVMPRLHDGIRSCVQGCCDVVQLLAEHCSHIDHTGAGSLTALHLACVAGHLSVVRLLSQRGANIEARDQASYAPLHIAALLNHMPVRARVSGDS